MPDSRDIKRALIQMLEGRGLSHVAAMEKADAHLEEAVIFFVAKFNEVNRTPNGARDALGLTLIGLRDWIAAR